MHKTTDELLRHKLSDIKAGYLIGPPHATDQGDKKTKNILNYHNSLAK